MPFSCYDIKHISISNKVFKNASSKQNIQLTSLKASAQEALDFLKNCLWQLEHFSYPYVDESIKEDFRRDVDEINRLISLIDRGISSDKKINYMSLQKLKDQVDYYTHMMNQFSLLSLWYNSFFDEIQFYNYLWKNGPDSSFANTKSLGDYIEDTFTHLIPAIKLIRTNVDLKSPFSKVTSEEFLREKENPQGVREMKGSIDKFNDCFSSSSKGWYEYLEERKNTSQAIPINLRKEALTCLIDRIKQLTSNSKVSQLRGQLEECLRERPSFRKFKDYVNQLEDLERTRELGESKKEEVDKSELETQEAPALLLSEDREEQGIQNSNVKAPHIIKRAISFNALTSLIPFPKRKDSNEGTTTPSSTTSSSRLKINTPFFSRGMRSQSNLNER